MRRLLLSVLLGLIVVGAFGQKSRVIKRVLSGVLTKEIVDAAISSKPYTPVYTPATTEIVIPNMNRVAPVPKIEHDELIQLMKKYKTSKLFSDTTKKTKIKIFKEVKAGRESLDKGDTVNAVSHYESAVKIPLFNTYLKMNIRDSIYSFLGKAYYYGWGCKRNVKKAIEYLDRWEVPMSKYKHRDILRDAYYEAGWQAYENMNTKEDSIAAFNGMLFASRLGNNDAYRVLGYFHANGIGTERDSLMAKSCYVAAAGGGDSISQCIMASNSLERRDYQGVIYFGTMEPGCKSVEQQLRVGLAEFMIGEYQLSADWYEKAAEKDQVEAYYALAELYSRHLNNKTKAFSYLEKIYAVEEPEAIYDIALCYFRGYGIEKDMDKAIALWKRGAENLSIPECQYCYGYALLKAIGVKKDKKQGRYWIELAAQNGCDEAKAYMENKKNAVALESLSPQIISFAEN